MSLFKRKKKKEENIEKIEKVVNEAEEKDGEITVITENTISEAVATLEEYKRGKANLENRVIENEQWWRQRHWEYIEDNSAGDRKPTSAWLFNSIVNKHADAMDNIPIPNILPREENDAAEAEMLSSIIPVVMEQNDFESTYSNVWNNKLVSGTGIYGVFWDSNKLNGLGDIAIREIDILNIFWEPGVQNIQDSRNIFTVDLVDNDLLEEMYPETKGKIGGTSFTVSEYIYDDSIDTSSKSAVIDWYYKKNGVLHFVKFVNNIVLFATENDENMRDTGLYDHGRYPFEFDPLYRAKGTPCGFGCVDISKSAQERIDRLQQAIDKNTILAAKPRFFKRADGKVNLEEFADTSKDFVSVEGNMDEDSLRQITVEALPGVCVSVLANTIEELKETSGNRDFSQGSTASGVTSGSAIAALQEAGTKLSRDMQKQSYRVYRNIVELVIELIRQFYDETRKFRIVGDKGAQKFVAYSNENIKATEMDVDMNGESVYRMPVFDISVSAQKESPFNRMAQNDLALQFYNMGFFNPQNAEMAIGALKMMVFDRKDEVIKAISENSAMYQQMQVLMQQQTLQQQAMQQGGAPIDQSNVMQAGQPILP